MKHLSSEHTAAWAGLVLDGRYAEADALRIQQVLGGCPRIILVRADEPALNAVRRLVHTRASSVLALARDEQTEQLASVLRMARSLASIRRVVVLHDADCDLAECMHALPALVLRDCAEVRASLRDIVGRDAAAHASALAPASAQGTPAHAGMPGAAIAAPAAEHSLPPRSSRTLPSLNRPTRAPSSQAFRA